MDQQIQSVNDNLLRQISDKMRKIKKEILPQTPQQTCQCYECIRNSNKFRIKNFPCIHTISPQLYKTKHYELSDFGIEEIPEYELPTNQKAQIYRKIIQMDLLSEDPEEEVVIPKFPKQNLSGIDDIISEMIFETHQILMTTLNRPINIYKLSGIYTTIYNENKLKPPVTLLSELGMNLQDEEDFNLLISVLTSEKLYQEFKVEF